MVSCFFVFVTVIFTATWSSCYFADLDLIPKEDNDHIIGSGNCAHVFHKECIMDWLERRANTECPVCRHPMVSDEDVVRTVEEMRKEQSEILRNQTNRFFQKCMWWVRRQDADSIQQQSDSSPSRDEERSRDIEEAVNPRASEGRSVNQDSPDEIQEDTASDSTSTASS